MKSKNNKIKIEKKTKNIKKTVAVAKKTAPKKTVKEKPKKFFPKNAKPSMPKKVTKVVKNVKKTKEKSTTSTQSATVTQAPVQVKRSPWAKKPIENLNSTPASSCYSMRTEFDNYIAKKYKRLKDDQIKSLWISVSTQMLSEPRSKLLELVDNYLSKK